MRRRLLPAFLLAIGLLLYPVIVLAGGAPRFPTRADCAAPARAGAPIDAVFGHFDDQAAAQASQRNVTRLGFTGSEIEPDGCGSLKVVVHGVPSLAVGRELIAEARRVGVDVRLERGAG
jgi:hypothetical protein